MGASGHGDSWSPINGNAPWWLNFLVWSLQKGVLFQLFFVAMAIGLILVILGRVDSPMLDAFEKIGNTLESQEETLDDIKREAVLTRGLNERIERHFRGLNRKLDPHE